ncbi:MAG: tyrosine--tRNA ligase [Candidatus Micrarchaeota archaeon]|nr:tyrosine--tRNA ligase [Candidatus Micrarchaeota archaeon]MCX8154642.1 tyrosine--tRNA ligase [Candidatus Micrarchaeota archaeon]
MSIETRLNLIRRRPTEEIVNEESLIQRLSTGGRIKHYIGFEVSGLIHLGTVSTLLKIQDLRRAGVDVNIFIADYHSWINRKFGGDLELIRKIANEYFKPFLEALGIEANYIMASELYDNEYWKMVIQIGNSSTVSRVRRTLTIMGREDADSNPVSFFIYPLMQAADIFRLDVDIAHAGMDQRKVHMLAIDVAKKIGKPEPICLHTHLIPALDYDGRMDIVDAKMSKSKEGGAIFIHDSEEQIKEKISKAYAPQRTLENNVVYEILKWMLVRDDTEEFTIHRDMKFGGDITITIPEFERLYTEGKIHPADVKRYVYERLVEMLRPARELTERKRELVEFVKAARTR